MAESTYSDPSLRRAVRWLSKRLRNRNDEYPWEVIRWDYSLALFVLPSLAVGIQDGVPLLGLAFGSAFLAFLIATAWLTGV